MRRSLVTLFAFIALAGCVTAADPGDRALAEVQLMDTARLAAIEVTPIAVVEDSRCPIGVQCIQAGTVRILARVTQNGGTRDMTLSLGEPLAVDSGRLTLVRVCPYPVYRSPIEPNDYRFSLRQTDAAAAPEPEVPACPTS